MTLLVYYSDLYPMYCLEQEAYRTEQFACWTYQRVATVFRSRTNVVRPDIGGSVFFVGCLNLGRDMFTGYLQDIRIYAQSLDYVWVLTVVGFVLCLRFTF